MKKTLSTCPYSQVERVMTLQVVGADASGASLQPIGPSLALLVSGTEDDFQTRGIVTLPAHACEGSGVMLLHRLAQAAHRRSSLHVAR
jgi:hypothetical protein